MKSTNKMGRDAFEKAFQERFDGSEIQPSEGLWAGIEAAIANHDADRYRRGMVYYRWVAAAGILLLVGFLGYLGFNSRSNNDKVITDASNQVIENITKEGDNNDLQKDQALTKTEQNKESREGKSLAVLEPDDAKDGQNQELPPVVERVEMPGENSTDLILTRGINKAQPITPTTESTEDDLTVPGLPERITGVVVYPVNEKSEKSALWAGLNMAPGYFNPNYSQQGLQAASPNSLGNYGRSSHEEHNSGLSMAVGVEMGMKLSGRWQVSSGIQYLNNNVQSRTDLVLDNRTPVFSSTVESLDLSAEARSNASYEPTELDNTFQFISIPVQAGYLLVDKKVKLLLNAGIASDVFLRNKITSVDRSLESVTISPGSDAPFKSVYFNGLLGAQASYEFLPRYQITLEPRYKLAFTEFTRSDVSYSSMPSTFGIGVGVKYVFK